MKGTVIQRFRDKESNKAFEVGATYEHQNKERFAELSRNGFITVDENQDSDSNQDSLLNGNAQDVIAALTNDIDPEKLQAFLEEESKGKDRKTVKEHIEALLAKE
ncbi:hypothetical protein M3204_03505 [Mesobacillus subterraneus]|uniref:hypothetical protein n=1 Tax=Mesobacillus subterraneus TaxID=285983 RepID=UPI00203ED925|nr:hypothetical protein [Mesobacillus subterraneus]MCM3663454.1 hypothetical protein [Mesobacillus subterraneus]MCM3683224.1 hypothetical protein [Mesobacillus subterraneus]